MGNTLIGIGEEYLNYTQTVTLDGVNYPVKKVERYDDGILESTVIYVDTEEVTFN